MGKLTGRHVRCTPSRKHVEVEGDERGQNAPLRLISLPSCAPTSLGFLSVRP